jgi:hypothetical protein
MRICLFLLEILGRLILSPVSLVITFLSVLVEGKEGWVSSYDILKETVLILWKNL